MHMHNTFQWYCSKWNKFSIFKLAQNLTSAKTSESLTKGELMNDYSGVTMQVEGEVVKANEIFKPLCM